MPIDFGGGMIFPNSYGADPPDPPDEPEPEVCPACDKGYLHHTDDRYSCHTWCDHPFCEYEEWWEADFESIIEARSY